MGSTGQISPRLSRYSVGSLRVTVQFSTLSCLCKGLGSFGWYNPDSDPDKCWVAIWQEPAPTHKSRRLLTTTQCYISLCHLPVSVLGLAALGRRIEVIRAGNKSLIWIMIPRQHSFCLPQAIRKIFLYRN